MKFLIVNDDGYQAEGIKILAESIKRFGEVVLYSPFKCESAQSHKITIKKGIKIDKLDCFDFEAYTVHGSAADCVRLGLFLNPDVDFVVSGINHGLNVGYDIFYSSTIAAINEAGLRGYRGIAFSCDLNFEDIKKNQVDSIVEEVILNNSKYQNLINVNFPSSKYKEYKGIKATVAGNWHFANKFDIVNGAYVECAEHVLDNTPNTDHFETQNGFVSISNLSIKRTY